MAEANLKHVSITDITRTLHAKNSAALQLVHIIEAILRGDKEMRDVSRQALTEEVALFRSVMWPSGAQ